MGSPAMGLPLKTCSGRGKAGPFVALPRRQDAVDGAWVAGHRCDPIADDFSAESFLGYGIGDVAVGTKVADKAVIGLCRAGRGEGEEECTGEQQDPGSLRGS